MCERLQAMSAKLYKLRCAESRPITRKHFTESSAMLIGPIRTAFRTGEESHYIGYRSNEPVFAWHSGLPNRARGYAPQPSILLRRQSRHLRLRHRQPALLSGKMGRGSLVERSVRTELRRHAAQQERGLRLGSAHDQIDGSQNRTHGSGFATRRNNNGYRFALG